MAYYRLKVFAVSDAGLPVGGPIVLNDTVTWDKLVEYPGDVIRDAETLGPTLGRLPRTICSKSLTGARPTTAT